jgi:hypothetical protein
MICTVEVRVMIEAKVEAMKMKALVIVILLNV